MQGTETIEHGSIAHGWSQCRGMRPSNEIKASTEGLNAGNETTEEGLWVRPWPRTDTNGLTYTRTQKNVDNLDNLEFAYSMNQQKEIGRHARFF